SRPAPTGPPTAAASTPPGCRPARAALPSGCRPAAARTRTGRRSTPAGRPPPGPPRGGSAAVQDRGRSRPFWSSVSARASASAGPPEPACRPRVPARPRLFRSLMALLLAALCPACSAPPLPVFTISGDAPSRTGLTPLGDGAVFGNDAGRVIRLDGAGRVLWTVETGAEIELPLVLTEDGVVGAVSGGDTLVALDADSGHERWRAGGQPPVAGLTAAGTRLVLLGKEGELRSFSARSGGLPLRRGWNASLGLRRGSPPRGLLSLERGVLAIGPAAVLLLSPEDGALRWKAPVREPTGAVLEGDALWIAEQSGRLLVLDGRSGAQRRV